MKKLALVVIIAIITIVSCKQPARITIDQVHQIEDSIPKIFPGAVTIHTIQNEEDSYNQVRLIVGDPTFYTSNSEQKQAMAIRTGIMLLHVLGSDNHITKATLIITKDTQNDTEDPQDGIKADMKIDSLEKARVK